MAEHGKSVAIPRAASNTWQCYVSWCCTEGQKVCKTAAFRAGGSKPCGTGSTSRRQRRGLDQPQGQIHPGPMPLCNGEQVTFTCSTQNNQDKNISTSNFSFSRELGSFKALILNRCLAGSTTLLRPAKAAASNGCWLDADVLRIPALSTLAPAQDAGGSARLMNDQRGGFCHHTGCLCCRHHDSASTRSSDCDTASLCQWLLLFVFLKALNKQETG